MGANRSLLGLVRGLQIHGVKSILLCPKEGDFTKALQEEGIEYLIAPFTNWVYTKVSINYYLFPLRIIQNQILLPSLTRKVKALNPDIIYTNSSVTAIGAYLAHRLGKKHVWHIREFVREHYKTNYVFGQTNFLKWMNRSAAVVSISQALLDGVLPKVTAPKHLVYNGIMGEEEMDALSRPPLAPKGESAHLTDKAQDSTLGARGESGKPFTFLNIGLIHPMKQQMQALKAFFMLSQKHDNIQLIFVGKGRRIYTWRMKQFCKKHQLENKVRIMGYVPNPSEIYQQADALLMCSLHEGMGRVTAEAMAYGISVIGYESGATPELVEHGVNGLLYQGNAEELATQMEYLILNREKATKMGEAGREKAMAQFTTEKYVHQIFQLLKLVLNTP